MNRIGVLHLLDTLCLGGAERSAVNLVNMLPRSTYRPYLCTTRDEGPLSGAVASDVGRITLARKRRFDVQAIRKLVRFVSEQRIQILHAHGTSLFAGVVAACFPPYPVVIWHAHYGRVALEDHRAWPHRAAARKIRGVITVNQQLSEWCGRRLGIPAESIWCIPNMVCEPEARQHVPDLPGKIGTRIICVANLREEKDHISLVRAMKLVVQRFPTAYLLLVGAHSDSNYSGGISYFEAVKREIARDALDKNIVLMGQRGDIPDLLRECNIGVLSSRTEGLPVSLLEYGMAGLPVVATRVGECEEVLDHGRAGLVVPPQSPAALAEALISLLSSSERRTALGERFYDRVRRLYSVKPVIDQVCAVYRDVLQPRAMVATRGEEARSIL